MALNIQPVLLSHSSLLVVARDTESFQMFLFSIRWVAVVKETNMSAHSWEDAKSGPTHFEFFDAVQLTVKGEVSRQKVLANILEN